MMEAGRTIKQTTHISMLKFKKQIFETGESDRKKQHFTREHTRKQHTKSKGMVGQSNCPKFRNIGGHGNIF